jgi:hypothetical protein
MDLSHTCSTSLIDSSLQPGHKFALLHHSMHASLSCDNPAIPSCRTHNRFVGGKREGRSDAVSDDADVIIWLVYTCQKLHPSSLNLQPIAS